jgi:hypothetical protein
MAMMIDTPEGIEAYRLLAIKGILKLELAGMRGKINTFAAVKREFGFKGSRQFVYEQYVAMLLEKGLLRDE